MSGTPQNKKRALDDDEAEQSPAAKRPKTEEEQQSSTPAVAYVPRRVIPGVHHAPSVREIVSDKLTQISVEYWGANVKFDAKVVEDIYNEHLAPADYNLSRIMLLELSHYLEKYGAIVAIIGNTRSHGNFVKPSTGTFGLITMLRRPVVHT